MARLGEIRQSLKQSLQAVTGISDWDYWGMAPDASFPRVGNAWPTAIMAAKPGIPISYEFIVTAALWSASPELLMEDISDLAEQVTQVYGPLSGCPTGLENVSGIEMGVISVGAPSTSAASAVGLEGGTWAAVSFTLTLATL